MDNPACDAPPQYDKLGATPGQIPQQPQYYGQPPVTQQPWQAAPAVAAPQPARYNPQYVTQQQPGTVVYSTGAYAQQGVIAVQPGPAPPDYLALALCVTFCCFFPFGIVAIFKVSETRNRAATGHTPAAMESAKSAKFWSMAGLGCGILVWIALTIWIGFLISYIVNYD